MKSQYTKCRVPAACLVTILLAGVAPSIATAATTTHSRVQGSTASLYYTSTSSSIQSNVYVSATQGQGNNPGTLYIFAYQLDLNGSLVSGYFNEAIPLTTSQFRMSSVQSASLNITGAVLQDSMGNSATADISVTWTGSGLSTGFRDTERYQIAMPDSGIIVDYHTHSADAFRNAISAGTLVINGTNFLAAGGEYSSVYLTKFSYIEIDITKPF